AAFTRPSGRSCRVVLMAQLSAAGSYSSTVGRRPPLYPPTAYSLPFGARASPRRSRTVGISALVVQTLAMGSYSSTVRTGLPLEPPTAYSLPFGAAARPRRYRAVGMGALLPQSSRVMVPALLAGVGWIVDRTTTMVHMAMMASRAVAFEPRLRGRGRDME